MGEQKREQVTFPAGASYCAGWHHVGTNGSCVVMAAGLGVTTGPGTDRFAERFAADGHSVLAFDYRRLGASGGHPRQLVRLSDQLEDWRAALNFARRLPEVDADRLAIWGFSLSGGHVLDVAARDRRLGAAIAQAPLADGLDAALYAARHSRLIDGLRLLARAGLDLLGGALGRQPLLIPLAGPPGTVASLTTPDAQNGALALDPDGEYAGEWRQEIAARSAVAPGLYRPARQASRITAPLLVVAPSADGVAPPEPAREAASKAPRGELLEVAGGHYAPYGVGFEETVAAELSFLRRHLGLPKANTADSAAAASATALAG